MKKDSQFIHYRNELQEAKKKTVIALDQQCDIEDLIKFTFKELIAKNPEIELKNIQLNGSGKIPKVMTKYLLNKPAIIEGMSVDGMLIGIKQIEKH